MNQSSASVAVELPERGVQWVKDQVETVLSETEDYVRERPAQSLLWAFVAGYILNRLPLGRILSGLLRLLMVAAKPAVLIYGAAKLYQSAQEEQRGSRAVGGPSSLRHSSRVKPIFSVTCHSSTFPSSMFPRVSVTSNHRMLRIV